MTLLNPYIDLYLNCNQQGRETMLLNLNAENVSDYVKGYFEMSGMTKSEVYFRRSGAVASVTIKGVTVKDNNLILNQLRPIISDALNSLDKEDKTEKKLDEDTLVAISGLRVSQ